MKGLGPVVPGHLVEDVGEGRVLYAGEPDDVLDALQDHVRERPPGGMAVGVDRIVVDREMPPAKILHRFFESERPRGHPLVENRAGKGAREGSRTVYVAV